MKRVLLSTLILATTVSPILATPRPASAIEETTEWGKLYTLEEVKEIYREYDQIRDETCKDDSRCRITFFRDFINNNPKYAVLDRYIGSTFTITSVNPETNSLKAYFRSLDLSTYDRMGRERYNTIKELYLCWLNPEFVVSNFARTMRQGIDDPSLHVILRAVATVEGGSWFPSDQEVEISAPGAKLIDDVKHTIYYNAWFESGNFTNSAEYSTCFEAGYQSGMECQLRIRENGDFIYLPYTIETEDNTTNTTENSPESTITIPDNSTITTDEYNKPIAKQAAINNDVTNPTDKSSQPISAPDTGFISSSSDDNRDKIVFPWWLGAVFAFGLATLVWLFWPSHKKSSKKFKKTIDKNL